MVPQPITASFTRSGAMLHFLHSVDAAVLRQRRGHRLAAIIEENRGLMKMEAGRIAMSRSNTTVELLVPSEDRCGEGPLWDWRRDVLIWADIPRRAVFQFDPARRAAATLGDAVPAGGIALCGDDGYIVAALEGMFSWMPGASPRPVLRELRGRTLRFNDILADPRGRIYAGTYYWGEEMLRPGQLYLVGLDGSANIVADDIELSNGLGLSPDGKTLYYADSTARVIYVFDVDPESGKLSGKRAFVKVPDDEGLPDGLTVDADGFIWSAQWYGGQIVRYDPDGSVERRIAMPVRQVASVAFGGQDLDELYVTTASEQWISRFSPPGYDYALNNDGGPVYRIRPGVQGKKEFVARITPARDATAPEDSAESPRT
jgi:D-xylonolactonase